jgi:hypothetical protein
VAHPIDWYGDSLRTDPPTDDFGHVDLLQGLSDIEQKAQDNEYESQTEFDTSLRNLLNSANDGHLGIQGLCSDSIFTFKLAVSLVSIANSSTSDPEIYELGKVQKIPRFHFVLT